MSEMTFGGYPVRTRKISNSETLVNCKGVTGTLSQLVTWLENHRPSDLNTYYFGVKSKQSEIKLDGQTIKIACLEEDYKSFKSKIIKLKLNNGN